MTFDHDRFIELRGEIEELLGYLKGNEQVADYCRWQYDEGARFLEDNRVDTGYGPPPYMSKPANKKFECDFTSLQVACPHVSDPDAEPDKAQSSFLAGLESDLEASWTAGKVWAEGIGDYIREICAAFTRAEPSQCRDVSEGLKRALDASGSSLNSLVPEDFASYVGKHGEYDFGSTLDNWTGEARDAFHTFYNGLPPKTVLYATLASICGDLVEATGALAAVTQKGLLDFLEGVREALESQLVEWANQCGPPESYEPRDLGWVGDVLTVAKDVITIIPVADKVLEVPGKVVTAADHLGDLLQTGTIIDKYVGDGDTPKKEVSFSARTAEEIYGRLTEILHDDLLHDFNEGLDVIESDRAAPLRAAVETLHTDGDFLPRSVPLITTTAWRPES